ncbi:MAG: hypothetical protein HZC25_08640 [Rhodospirillales bacterium]|nr:hypothetical protein [Rhodospirillales bacterium]
MSLQSDLQAAVAKVTADSATLHQIVHGDATTTVSTENGPVKSMAKAVADVEAAFGDVDTARIETLAARDVAVASAGEAAADKTAAQGFRDEAEASAVSAAGSALAAQVAQITWRGPWNGATAYAIHDAVTLGGTSYVCILPHIGQQPPDAAHWDLLAAKGDTGPAANLGHAVPLPLGTSAPGSASFAAREDHVHDRGDLVDGPASAGDGELARFDGVTGKLIKGGGKVQASDLATDLLGTAAARDTGTASGQIPTVQSDGRLPASVMPPNDGAHLCLLAHGF